MFCRRIYVLLFAYYMEVLNYLILGIMVFPIPLGIGRGRKAKAIAFDEIDKAPEEKKRGITIATVGVQILFSLAAYFSMYFMAYVHLYLHHLTWVNDTF